MAENGQQSVGQVALDLVLNKRPYETAMKSMGQTAMNAGKRLGGAMLSGAKNMLTSERAIVASGKRIAAAVAGAFAIRKIVQFSAACISLGSDLAEMENVTNTVFPHMTKQVAEFSKAAANTAGQTETQAKNYIGTLGAMAKAYGVTEQKAFEMATTVTQLTGDVSSFYNLSQDEAFQKLKSIFTGEAESLKSLGVVMTQTALDEYAMANGFGKVTANMSESEKMMLRYEFVQSKLSAANGDFLRTTDSWANQMKRFNLNLSEVKTNLGQGMINILLPVIKWVNVLMQRLASAANAFKAFTGLFTGKKAEQTSGTAAAIASEVGNAADAANNLAGNTTKAGKAASSAAKAMQALFGFDQINKLNEESSSDGSGGSGGGDAGAGAEEIVGDAFDFGELDTEGLADGLESKAKELIDACDWEGLGRYAAQKVNIGLEKVYEIVSWENVGPRVTPVIEAVTGIFNGFVDELDWDLLGRDISAGINTAVNTANGLLEGVNWKNLGKKLSEGANGAVQEINADNIGRLIANKFNAAWGTALGFVSNFSWTGLGDKIADGINGYFSTAKLKLKAETAARFLNGLFDTLYTTASKTDWDKVAENITDSINAFIETYDWAGNASKLSTFLINLVGCSANIIKNIDWEEFGEGVGDAIAEIDWSTMLVTAATALWDAFLGLLKGLTKTKVGAWGAAIGGAILLWKTTGVIAGWAGTITGALGTSLTSTGKVSILGKALGKLFELALAHPAVAAAIGAVTIGGILANKAFTLTDEEIEQINKDLSEKFHNFGLLPEATHESAEQDIDAANKGKIVQYKDTDYGWNPETGSVFDPNGRYYNNAYDMGWVSRDQGFQKLSNSVLDIAKKITSIDKKIKTENNKEEREKESSRQQSNGMNPGYTGGGLKLQPMDQDIVLHYQMDGSQNNPDVITFNKQSARSRAEKILSQKTDGSEKDKNVVDWHDIRERTNARKDLSAVLPNADKENISTFNGAKDSKAKKTLESGWSSGAEAKVDKYGKTTSGSATKTLASSWTSGSENRVGKYTGADSKTVTKTLSSSWTSGSENRVGKYTGASSQTVTKTLSSTWSSGSETRANKYAGLVSSTVRKTLSVSLTTAVDKVTVKLKKVLGLSSGGAILAGGRVVRYASGTTNAHGSIILAGENGPEVAGHLNGRTEILNQSQLAQTMYRSVQAAFRPLVSIVRYATPQLAMIGDSRRQLGYSDEHIRQIIEETTGGGMGTSDIMRVLQNILNWLEQLDPNVYLDGTKITKRVIEETNKITRSTGRTPILV